jgi:polysaccharide chain length determinant protein (PEP-CTERM system associated)
MIDFKYYASIFLRRFPYFLIVAVLISAIGISVATVLPQQYRANALLLVEDERISTTEGKVVNREFEQLQIVQQLLESRGNLLELANRLNIYTDRASLDPSEIVADMRDRIDIDLQFAKEGATTVAVAFTAGTGQKSADVVNEIVTMMLETNVDLQIDSKREARDFFEQQVKRLGEDLDRQSADILQFKLEHPNGLPDSLEYRRTRQTALQERLLQLQREGANLNDRKSRLIDLFESTGRVDLNTENMTPEETQLTSLRSQLDNALTVFSPTHPNIRVLQSQINSLETIVANQGGEDAAANQGLSLFEIQKAELEGQISYIAELTTQVQTELASLGASIDATPGNAIQLSEMERDYANTQQQYNTMTERFAAAQTREEVERTGKGGRITIIENAVVPPDPYSPNRPLIAGASVGLGLLLGLGVIFLMEMLNRSIRRPVEIERKLGLTPIATLPYIRTSRELLVRRSAIMAALFVSVVGIPLALWAAHTFYLPMDLLVDRALEKTGLAGLLDSLSQSEVR